MVTISQDELTARLARGEFVQCARCKALCRAEKTQCFTCGAPLHEDALEPDPVPGAGASKRRKPTPTSRYKGSRKNEVGTLTVLPDQELVLVVRGQPQSQGSMKAIASGVMRHSNPKVIAWRDAITREALLACGIDWQPADAPVTVNATFTVPTPTSARKRLPTLSRGYRDLDKLQRGVGDALCPSDTTRFRVYASDMLIDNWHAARTHPRPLHTHPDALDEPGVVIRIRPTPDPNDLLPLPDLPTTTTWKR